MQLKNDDTFCEQKIRTLLQTHLQNTHGKVTFVQAVGGAHPPRNSNLRHYNYDAAISFANGVNAFLQDEPSRAGSTLVQLSSAAAEWLEDDYGLTKRETDQKLTTSSDFSNIDHIFALRIGYVVGNLKEVPSKIHPFTPQELIKHSLVHPIIVQKGREPKFHPIHVNDIAEAILKTHQLSEKKDQQTRKIVNVTGSQEYSQSAFFQEYANIIGRKLVPLPITADFFEKVAKYHPSGHIAPYAAEYAKLEGNTKLDNSEFQKLLGRELTPLNAVGEKTERSDFFIPNPFFRYIPTVIKKIILEKKTRDATLTPFISVGFRATKTYLRAKLGLK
ncbi:MAG: hypothetical protein ChlgKO_11100 [Chlamydiales bacterium]